MKVQFHPVGLALGLSRLPRLGDPPVWPGSGHSPVWLGSGTYQGWPGSGDSLVWLGSGTHEALASADDLDGAHRPLTDPEDEKAAVQQVA